MSKTFVVILIIIIVLAIAGTWWHISLSQHSTAYKFVKQSPTVSVVKNPVAPKAVPVQTATVDLLNNPSALSCGSTALDMSSSKIDTESNSVLSCFGNRIAQCQPTTIQISTLNGTAVGVTVGIGMVNSQCAISMKSSKMPGLQNCPSIDNMLKATGVSQQSQPALNGSQVIFASLFYQAGSAAHSNTCTISK